MAVRRGQALLARLSWSSPLNNPLFAMFGLGPTELLIVAAVVLLLFGTRLPKVMRALGEGIVEFKRGVQGIEDTGSSGRDAGRPDAR